MFINSDFSDLLKLLDANQVKYLVIGGYALGIIGNKKQCHPFAALRASSERVNDIRCTAASH